MFILWYVYIWLNNATWHVFKIFVIVILIKIQIVSFTGLDSSGFGTVIRNDRGEVMAAMFAKGLAVQCSEEAEMLAYQKAIEFAMDAGFAGLVIEGDNTNVMHAISSLKADRSLIGMWWVIFSKWFAVCTGWIFAAREEQAIRSLMCLHNILELFQMICIWWKTYLH